MRNPCMAYFKGDHQKQFLMGDFNLPLFMLFKKDLIRQILRQLNSIMQFFIKLNNFIY